jgi:hypothetical protein
LRHNTCSSSAGSLNGRRSSGGGYSRHFGGVVLQEVGKALLLSNADVSLKPLLGQVQTHLGHVYVALVFSLLNRGNCASYVTKGLAKRSSLCGRQETLRHGQQCWVKQAVLTLSKHVLHGLLSSLIFGIRLSAKTLR